jgi:hypothetical protein
MDQSDNPPMVGVLLETVCVPPHRRFDGQHMSLQPSILHMFFNQ